MSCSDWRQMFDDFADDCCPPKELAGLEAHLRACPECAAEALAQMKLKRATRAAAERFAPTPEFRLRMETMLQQKSRPWWKLAPGAGTSFASLATALAALLLIAVSGLFWMRHAAREQALTELLDVHIATLASANPVDVISTDRHTVKPWFQGKLPFTFNLPELQNSPYKLLGGRMMYFEHSPAAQLVFEARKHQVSVFIFENRPGLPLPGAAAMREKGFSIESWSVAGLRYVAVSDTGPADLQGLSELLKTAAQP